MNGKLTERQTRFCEAYMVSGNAKQAAEEAGYSVRSAGMQGARLMTKANVISEITRLKRERSASTKIDADFVLRGAAEVFARCMQHIRPATDARGRPIKDADGNAIWKFDANGANAALALLGKHISVGAFADHLIVENVQSDIERLNAGRARVGMLESEPIDAVWKTVPTPAQLAAPAEPVAEPLPGNPRFRPSRPTY